VDLGSITHFLYGFFINLGGFGLLLLGVLDSSFLFMPLGNDLLVLALCARRHVMLPYYAAMAAAGSVLGCLLLDLAVRKGGESELEKHLSPRQIESIKRRIKARAGFALAFASLMPPPFPFTPFVIGAAAFQYPRKRLLAVVGGARLLRFGAEGALAIFFGQQILDLARTGWVKDLILALVALAVAGSVLSVVRWIRSRRKA
jgi:membrane protein DedA with SNARE-associated domain